MHCFVLLYYMKSPTATLATARLIKGSLNTNFISERNFADVSTRCSRLALYCLCKIKLRSPLYIARLMFQSQVLPLSSLRIALSQAMVRGWLTYTDMAAIWEASDVQETMMEASVQAGKVL